MESISLDASLNLPTIDPTPARTATLPADSHRRFDDELRRASFPTLEERSRGQHSAKQSDAVSKTNAARNDEPPTAAVEPADNDSPGDDSLVEENSDDDTTGVDTAADKSDKQDEPVAKADEATAAAIAAAQNATEKVADKPTMPAGAQAQPDTIAPLQEPGQQTSDSPVKTAPVTASAVANSDADTLVATSDTPDVTAEKVVDAVAASKPSELHATDTQSANVAVSSKDPVHAEATNAQSASAAISESSPEAVSPIADPDDSGDKKQRSAKPRGAVSDIKSDAHGADAALADEAKSRLQSAAAAAVNDEAAQAAADATTQIVAAVADNRAGDSQASNATSGSTSQAVDSSGKNGAAPPPAAPAGTTATQKLLDGTSRTPVRGDNTSEVERARFVQRVSKAFQTASERGGPLRLRLSPPELGAVRMEVSIRGGVMTARLEAETSTAQAMLLDNLPALRERLAQHNIKVERFDVDLLGQSSDGSQQSPTDTSDRQAGRAAPANQPRRTATATAEDKPTAAPTRRTSGSGQLNVII